MSDKQAKKLRKLYRRDIKEIRAKVMEDFRFLGTAIKPRPKYIPFVIWQNIVNYFIDTAKLKEVIQKSAKL